MSSAVIWSLLSTALRLGGALLVLPVVLRYLPPEQLGLWYVFQSVASVALLMDAGFGLTVMRSMGYLWQGVSKLLPTGLAQADEVGSGRPNYKLMADLIVTMNWYYRLIALLILVALLGPGSLWIWYKTAMLHDVESLRGAWLFFSFGTALNMAAGIWWGLLIGINGVRMSEQIFGGALLLNYTIVAIGLRLGWGLWAMVAGQVAQGVATRLGGKLGFLHLAGAAYRQETGKPAFDLLQTLWPMSWRSAVMGLGSCLILYSNTIICSTYLGLAETGSYGLTFQLITAISGVSAIWVNVKLPLMNQMRAAGDTTTLAALFICRLRLSLATYIAGALGLLFAGPWFVDLIGSKTHLLSADQTLMLLFIMFLTTHQSLHTSLVLSQNRNPFVASMLITGVGIGAVSFLLVPRFGMWGLLVSFGVVQLAFMNWWTVAQGLKSLHLPCAQFFRDLLLGPRGACIQRG